MEQNLGRGNDDSSQIIVTESIHPDQAPVDAIVDSHQRRGYHCEEDEKLLSTVDSQIKEGTINDYTPKQQRDLRRMLEKDPWRS